MKLSICRLLNRFCFRFWFFMYGKFITSLTFNPHKIGNRYMEWQFDYIAGIPSCEPKNFYGDNYGKKN